jgi:hypothetical protein
LILLQLQSWLNDNGIAVNWQFIGEKIEPGTTGGAIVQHLAKQRVKAVNEGLNAPPPLRRTSKKHGLLSTKPDEIQSYVETPSHMDHYATPKLSSNGYETDFSSSVHVKQEEDVPVTRVLTPAIKKTRTTRRIMIESSDDSDYNPSQAVRHTAIMTRPRNTLTGTVNKPKTLDRNRIVKRQANTLIRRNITAKIVPQLVASSSSSSDELSDSEKDEHVPISTLQVYQPPRTGKIDKYCWYIDTS